MSTRGNLTSVYHKPLEYWTLTLTKALSGSGCMNLESDIELTNDLLDYKKGPNKERAAAERRSETTTTNHLTKNSKRIVKSV
jgi:hypothetical protein